MTRPRRPAAWWLGCALVLPLAQDASAALSQGTDEDLQAATQNQTGGTLSSQQFKQQSVVGDAMAAPIIRTTKYRIIPGFLGASGSSKTVIPPSDLDLTTLRAKTAPGGADIPPQTWQLDKDPLFIWEPPPTGVPLAGYSFSMDGAPDDTVDTTGTSFDVATSAMTSLADGKHTFTVKAINAVGVAGKPVSMDLWVDTTAPQIAAYAPSPGTLTNVAPAISATLSDASSGVSPTGVTLTVNGGAAAVTYDAATGTLTATGGAWKEGANSLELRIADLVGNEQAPLVWSITLDTMPPTGTLVINGGAVMTTSVYVTLGLEAEDETSGVDHLLLSNDQGTGFVQEPYAALRPLWKLTPIRGIQKVYVKFVDKAGNASTAAFDAIDLALLSPDTFILAGPAGTTPLQETTFSFMCPEGGCMFSYAFDTEEWSDWSAEDSVTAAGLSFGNHYFRVKAAKDLNGVAGIQPDEEDPSPAERTWIIGVEPSVFTVPRGPHIKVWRLE
jgi:hypothetical protein